MRKVILYIAVSLDGYIARKDGSIDWLPQPGETDSDFGYKEFYDNVDTILMGKKTYDQVLTFGDWPYPGKECIVFSREDQQDTENVKFAKNPVSTLKERKQKPGKNIWLVGGSGLNTVLLEGNLVDEIIIAIIPKILGEGIPLSGKIEKDVEFKLDKSEVFDGIIMLYYIR